jgi:hypothetical protein
VVGRKIGLERGSYLNNKEILSILWNQIFFITVLAVAHHSIIPLPSKKNYHSRKRVCYVAKIVLECQYISWPHSQVVIVTSAKTYLHHSLILLHMHSGFYESKRMWVRVLVKHASELWYWYWRRATNSVVYIWWEILTTTELISVMLILWTCNQLKVFCGALPLLTCFLWINRNNQQDATL